MPFVYLDNSATTRPLDRVIDAVAQAMRETDWNPSALYRPAIDAERIVNSCRDTLKQRLAADRVVFTSGGTEADNLGIRGFADRLRKPGTFLFSAAEHSAVLEQRHALESRGHTVRLIPLTSEGLVNLDALESMMDPSVALIAVMEVSNETGAVQPLQDVIALRDRFCPSAALFVDGVQGFMRTDYSRGIISRGIDMYSISGHKIHAPKGVGALGLSKRIQLTPLVFGGGQESGLRSGTENVSGITGLACAMNAFDECAFPIIPSLSRMKLKLINTLRDAIPDIQINGSDPSSERSAAHIVNFSPPGIGGEVLVHALEREGVYVGTGSACSSKKKHMSAGFKSMGISQERAGRAVRVSLSPWTTSDDIGYAANAIVKAHRAVYPYRPR